MRAVNLLTPDQRSTPKGSSGPSAVDAPGGIGAFVLLGALALCVAGLAGYVLSNNVVKDRKAELAQVRAESAATVAQAGKLKPYADFQALAQARAGTVQALAAARFDWEQSLRDLSRAMPKEVFLSSLDGTVGGGASSGSGLRSSVVVPGDRAQGLHEEPAGRRRSHVADAQRPGRDPRGALEVPARTLVAAAPPEPARSTPAARATHPRSRWSSSSRARRSPLRSANATGAPDPAAAAEPAAAATPSATDKAKEPATGAAPTTPPAAATTGGCHREPSQHNAAGRPWPCSRRSPPTGCSP